MQVVRPERESAQLSLSFQLVPAYELLISLAAAAQPEARELPASWARQVRTALPAAARRDLGFFFGDPMALGTGPIQLVPDLADGEPETLVVALESLDTPDLIAAILSRGSGRQLTAAIRRSVRGRAGGEDERLIARHLGTLRAQTRRRFREILADPAAMGARYLRLLRAHHDGWFRDRYPELVPTLAQRARQGRRSIGKLPPEEVIARATGGFTLRSRTMRSVTLVPSYYAAPFVYIVREGRDVVLVYGARPREEMGQAWIDTQSIKLLKALADETRLRILQLLAQRPMYGQQLAEALEVSHPTISHHMTQLRIAGLTRTELTEDGNKAYSVQPEVLEELFTNLRAALVTPQVVPAAEAR